MSTPNERVWCITQLAKLSFTIQSVVLTADVFQFFIKTAVTTVTGQQQLQLHDLNQRLQFKSQEETHPHEQKPLPNPQNCCNRRRDYNSSRLESKNYGEKFNAKNREVSRTKI